MSVYSTLQSCLAPDGKSINITPALIPDFGQAIIAAISNVFSGSVQVNGAAFSLKPSDSGDGAVVTGTGSGAPLVQQFQVTFTFTDSGGNVTMTLVGSLTTAIPVTSAWSGATYPFTDVTISGGTVTMTVNPSDSSFDLAISTSANFESSPLGTGLLEVSYANSKLGFLGGFIVTSGDGSWSPAKDLPVLGTLSLSGEAGAFFSTITVTDLSAFKSLNLPYLPSEIDPGVTFLASITLTGTLAPIAKILPKGTQLDLLANIPPSGISGASITAEVTAPPPTNSFTFTDLKLAWKSTSADSGSISIAVTAVFNDGINNVDLTGDVTLTYNADPALASLDGDITVSGDGPWTHPFGIQNLTILSFSLGFSLADDGIELALGGTIGIGSGQGAVTLTLDGGIEDFYVPVFILAELSPESKGATVTLAQLIDDFAPMDLTKFPLLNDISFQELEFYAVAQQTIINNQQYSPGVGATGIIEFFGYDLDFAFSLITSPSVAVQAKGSISYQGGPIVVTIAGLKVLTISDSTGTKGPSACIDTLGSGYCGGSGGNNYFYINAAVNLLGLASASVVAQASSSTFEFDMALAAGGVFTENIHVQFDPSGSSPNFAASVASGFNPPNITLGPWGVIPQFTIPLPQINLCCALGTIMPTAAPCSDGWMPQAPPYFHFDLSFSWGPIAFSLNVSLDFAQVTNAFNDFSSWILNFVLNNAGEILGEILADAAKLAQLLIYIGKEILELAEWVYDKVVAAIESVFGYAYEVASQIVQDAVNFIEQCAQDVGNSLLGAPVGAPSLEFAQAAPAAGSSVGTRIRVPSFEVDLPATAQGRQLLQHYYVHRAELQRIVKSDTPAGANCRTTLSEYRQHPGFAEGKTMPLIIGLVNASLPAGSAEYRASAAEVLTALEAHREATYTEFLAVLAK
jgi:hypothetical protein